MKNIKLAYILSALHYSWFWLGIWVLYYSQFGGNYAVGVLEFVMVFTTILAEIPTGAVGDLLGKRKTLILGYLLLSISSFWIGLAPNLLHMALSLVLMNIGGAFISGTLDAMVYETLKEHNKVREYSKVQNTISSVILVTMGICSIIGGYLANISIRLPFIANGIGQLLAFFVAFLIVEPKTESIKLSISIYLKQNIEGFKHLFKTKRKRSIVIPMILVSAMIFLLYQSFNEILLLDFGFRTRPFELGIYASIASFAGAFMIYIAPRILRRISPRKFYLNGLVIYSLSLFASPFLWLYSGAASVFVRSVLGEVLDNHIKLNINKLVKSKYRATALSTFSMVKSIPYAISILFLASLTDIFPSKYIAVILGVVLIVISIWEIRKERQL